MMHHDTGMSTPSDESFGASIHRTNSDPSSAADSAPSPAIPPTLSVDSTNGAADPLADAALTDPAVIGPRFGGGLSLLIAGIGLAGAAVGGVWLTVDQQLGLSPQGLFGIALVLIAATLTVLGSLLLLGGLGYYVFQPVFGGRVAARRGIGSHRLVIATTILIVLIANLIPVPYLMIYGQEGLQSLTGLLLGMFSVGLTLLGVAYVRFLRPGVVAADELGLTGGPAHLLRLVACGVGVGVAVLVASAAIQATMKALGVEQTQMTALAHLRDLPLPGFLAVMAGGAILAPVAEELYFRGIVFGSYLRFRTPLIAYVGTSLLFATLHLNGPAFPPILAMSLILCWAYHRTGSIIPGIVGHMLNNTAAFGILYFTNALV
jgi:membrane protease YdiL (CAAX protease family)